MEKNKTSIPGSNVLYTIHSDAKRYTLRDNGFLESKKGNFQYERPLTTVISDKTAPKLKVTISKSISELKLSTVHANGLKKIDLYKNDNQKEARQFAEYILENFVKEGVLQKVDE